MRSTFSEITEQEEYYIGRAVSALILSRYKVLGNAGLTDYVNVCGKTVSYSSDRPETFGGYHFLILDTDEVNALAAPGGFVFVTKGLVKRCKDEEMLASILAHEIGHVSAKHGLQSIKKSRLVDAFKVLGKEAATRYGSKELAELTGIFENVLGDIVESLVEKGYDRKYEYEADKLGVKFAAATGYDPNGLARFLKTMTGGPAAGGAKGWFKTHPSAEDRLGKVNAQIKGMGAVPKTLDVRTARFLQAGERTETLTGPGRMSKKLVRGLAVGGAVFLVALLVHSLGVFESARVEILGPQAEAVRVAVPGGPGYRPHPHRPGEPRRLRESAEPSLALAAPDLRGPRGLPQGRRRESGLLRPHPERGLAIRGRGRRDRWPGRWPPRETFSSRSS